MDIGILGLSGASSGVARRLARRGVHVFGFDPEGRATGLADEKVLVAMPSVVALAHTLSAPRVVWMNVTPGRATELTIQDVWPELAAGDVIVDASGSRYEDAQRRAAALATARLHFVDCAIAPAVDDLAFGHVVVFGANPTAARIVAPFAQLLAPEPERGWLHCGPVGCGHYVRMVCDGLAANASHHVVNETLEQGMAAPVSSLALLLHSGDASRIADAEHSQR